MGGGNLLKVCPKMAGDHHVACAPREMTVGGFAAPRDDDTPPLMRGISYNHLIYYLKNKFLS